MYVAVDGYPGSGFHFGAFRDAEAYKKFSAATKTAPFSNVDWEKQMVVFAVLDAQTNSLDFLYWTVDAKNVATLQFDWIGIEPYYVDATPAVMALVDRASVKTIEFAPKDAQVLGRYRLP